MEEDAEIDAKSSSKFPLPQVFLQFLQQNGIDPAVYDDAHNLPRYIRYHVHLLVHQNQSN